MTPNHHDTPSTHLTLLEGVRGGEQVAWALFFERYGPVVLRWARQRGLQEVDAENIVQALMSDAPRKLATYQSEDEHGNVQRFRPWLRSVVNRLAADRWRDQQRRPGNYGAGGDGPALADITTEDSDGIADAITDEYCADMNRVVEAVRARVRGENTWAIYQARELEGLPVADVAATYQTNVGAVFQIVNRVNKMLKEEYRKLFPDPLPPDPEKPHGVPG